MLRTLLPILFLAAPLVARGANQPHITMIDPHRGPTGGGTVVQITGEFFDQLGPGVIGVVFGHTPATAVQVVSPTLITAIAPRHARQSVTVRLSINGVPVDFGDLSFFYQPGPAVTTTTTTTSTTTSSTEVGATTTTLVCGACADADPCTMDTCENLTCRHRAVTIPADLVGQTSQCDGQPVPARVGARFILGCDLVREGRTAVDQKLATRRFKSAVRVYSRAIRVTRRAVRGRRISSDCSDGLGRLLDSARTRARSLQGS